jgi:hypothetical protein
MLPGVGSSQDDSPPALRTKDPSGALVVETEPRCSEAAFRSPEVVVRWSINPDNRTDTRDLKALLAASDFRIDYSKFPGGIDAGRFESLKVSASEAKRTPRRNSRSEFSEFSIVARDLRAGVYYSLRVLVKTADGWVTSSQVGFLSSVCPADGIED